MSSRSSFVILCMNEEVSYINPLRCLLNKLGTFRTLNTKLLNKVFVQWKAVLKPVTAWTCDWVVWFAAQRRLQALRFLIAADCGEDIHIIKVNKHIWPQSPRFIHTHSALLQRFNSKNPAARCTLGSIEESRRAASLSVEKALMCPWACCVLKQQTQTAVVCVKLIYKRRGR